MKNACYGLWLLLLGVVLSSSIRAQPTDKYPKDYFRSPLDIPLFLAGNFAEIRPNHFHGGLDMKTEGVEGKNIYAAAEGYVARIKVSTFGYGKVLYIKHPNGYTTTYAHMQSFNDDITAYVQQAQYQKESWEIELFPQPGELPVAQGDVIGLSGNTGGSGGPHLHFEIRDSQSEVPINPLLFGFDIKDNIPPTIKHVAIYPMGDSSGVAGVGQQKVIAATGGNGSYKLSGSQSIEVTGSIAFGIEVIDKLNGTSNRNGVYSIELLVDSERVYYHDMEKVPFHESRYINCHIDYGDKKRNGRRIQCSFVQPNNKLSIYENVRNNGIVTFSDAGEHLVQYVIHDTHGNKSTLEFKVISKPETTVAPPPATVKPDTTIHFAYDHDNLFNTADCRVFIPKNLLYHDIDFTYSKKPKVTNGYSDVHLVHNTYTPLHSYMDLSIRPGAIPQSAKRKALIVALDNNMKFLAAEGGEWNGDFIRVRTRTLGPYTVMVDSIAPRIVSLNLTANKNMAAAQTISMKISDNMAGISTYKGYIDGKWCLMEYDHKTDKLIYEFDDARVEKGPHTFRLVVTDKRGNSTEFIAPFTR